MSIKQITKIPVDLVIIGILFRTSLALRYKIRFEHHELIKTPAPKLFLPCHQALVDPQIIVSHVYKHTRIAPVITEEYTQMPLAGWLLKRLHAVAVTNLEAGKRDVQVMNNISEKVNDALCKGENVLLYPSGRLTSNGLERIGNKRSAYMLAQNFPPHARIIGVRITGLWGSLWSRAKTGKTPNLLICFLKSLGIVLGNFIFFVPKRKVTFEFIDLTSTLKEKSKEDKKHFNQYLESFYNERLQKEKQRRRYFFYLPYS